MNTQELLPSGAIEAMASQLGISPAQAKQGAEALLPSLLHGMSSKAPQVETQVHSLGGAALAQNVVGPQPTQLERGNQLLGGIFGSKDVSREVAGHASQTSGLDPALLKKMLPMLVMLLAGHLTGRSQGQQGGLGGVLGSVLGGISGGGGGLGSVLGSVLGARRQI